MRARTTAALAAALFAAGCASDGAAPRQPATQAAALEARISQLEQELGDRDHELRERNQEVSRLNERLTERAAPTRAGSGAGAELLPPNAAPGECYARVHVPAQYRVETERVVKRAASERIEVVPARFETVEERALVKEASTRIEVIPATYEFVEERILVEPESTRLEEVPAVYGWEEERVLVKPAHTVWKKGRGPIERVDDATGEIMCLVDVPAEYETVRRRVMTQPPTTRNVVVPARYKTVKKRALKTPPTTREIPVPAEYETVKVRRQVEPGRERRVEIPPEFETIQRRVLVSEGGMDWRPVLCETNASPAVIAQIQQALKGAGHDPGPIDGVVGQQTLAAVSAFQDAKRLPRGGLNFETIAALGVQLGR